MKNKVCLVAGGAGFIGVNLVSELLDQGANVFVETTCHLARIKIFITFQN